MVMTCLILHTLYMSTLCLSAPSDAQLSSPLPVPLVQMTSVLMEFDTYHVTKLFGLVATVALILLLSCLV